MSTSFLSESPEITATWAAQLAALLHPPVVVALRGDLGSGKTHIAQAMARALGVTVPVTSPTFTLINEYPLPDGDRLYHVDCYRLEDPIPEAIDIGLDELFDQGIVVVEWADRIEEMLPARRLDIILENMGGERRRITVSVSPDLDPIDILAVSVSP